MTKAIENKLNLIMKNVTVSAGLSQTNTHSFAEFTQNCHNVVIHSLNILSTNEAKCNTLPIGYKRAPNIEIFFSGILTVYDKFFEKSNQNE